MNKIYSLLLILIMVPALCVAEDKAPTVISDSWTMVPKSGQEADFEKALKEHLAFRMEKGDTRHWNTYVPVTGKHLNQYTVRSCCNEWAEQDSYRAWSNENIGNHFNETVHPYVENYMHNYSVLDTKNSNWGENTDASYVGVSSFHIKSGKGKKTYAALKEMSTLAKDNGWSRNWSWSYPVAGTEKIYLVTPYANFAAMAPMEESFYAFVKKHLKSEKKTDKLFEKFNSGISEVDYQIYRHRKDLSHHHDDDKE